ncbi:MAG: M20/M25/M40 family metallo-hydrolase [Mobilicoccus sp.]|nr:M20/M25/M40 family metallo-hydrolase [Mobilicoccus sp.]
MKPRTRAVVIAMLAVALVAVVAYVAISQFARVQPPQAVDSDSLRAAITTERLVQHLDALQQIADDHDGNRQAGTAGHAASMDYVEAQLKAAGHAVVRQEFSFGRAQMRGRVVSASSSTNYRLGTDFTLMQNSGSGSVTAPVSPVDLALDGGEVTSGCEASDFAGFARGSIALVQRGTCQFAVKVEHAQQAGAAAVVVLNQGDTDDRRGLFDGTLRDATSLPVLAVTYDVGVAWASTPTTLTLEVDATPEIVTTANLIADTPGNPDRTIVVGAHLDSVASGPGINDNGTGVAAMLETATQLGRLDVQPVNRVRFAFWSGEEDGLLGSRHYVDGLDEAGRRATALYLNLDMVGSPNPVPHVYGDPGWPRGSEVVQSVLADHLAAQGVRADEVSFEISDHGPFLDAGIPVGGLYTGAFELKTAGEAADFGGEADAPRDPCYHEACDIADTIDTEMLTQMARTTAHAVLAFAEASDLALR